MDTNSKVFVELYDSLSRKLAYDIQHTTAKQSICILHEWLLERREPAILIEALYTGSATYSCYYPLDEDNYRAALPRCGLVRFNMNNIYSGRKQAFSGMVDRRDGICYLHITLDLPTPPSEPSAIMNELQDFMEAFAQSLCIAHRPGARKGGGRTGASHEE